MSESRLTPPEEFREALERRAVDRQPLQKELEHALQIDVGSVLGTIDVLQAKLQEAKVALETMDLTHAQALLSELEQWKMAFEPLGAPHPRRAGKEDYGRYEGFRSLDQHVGARIKKELKTPGAKLAFGSRFASNLKGIDSAWAFDVRELLMDPYIVEVAFGLEGLDSERAWEMRDTLVEQERRKASMAQETATPTQKEKVETLYGPTVTIVTGGPPPKVGSDVLTAVAQSLTGIESKRAWQMRELLAQEEVFPNVAGEPYAVAYSLSGLNSANAWQWRERLAPVVPHAVAISFRGLTPAELNSDHAWKVRDILLTDAGDSTPALQHIVETTLRGVDSADARRVIADLQSRLDTQRAAGPPETPYQKEISEIIKISGTDSPYAWSIRDRLQDQHPELVVAGLRGLDSERAWAMRVDLCTKLGEQLPLTSLVASMQGLVSERAWAFKRKLAESSHVQLSDLPLLLR